MRLATGTPSFVDARLSSVCIAAAAAATHRRAGARLDPGAAAGAARVDDLIGVTCRGAPCVIGMFSSSATICSSPVVIPFPTSIWLVLSVAALSARIDEPRVDLRHVGQVAADVDAARASPATPAPTRLKPTTSAPPPFRNDLRENSFSCIKPCHHAPAFAITAAAFWIAVRILG